MQGAAAGMFDFGPNVLEVIARCVIIYGFLLIAFRVAGKRELGQMTPFDLVLILVISNAVQNAMVGAHTSVTAGLLAAATLFVLNMVVGVLKQSSRRAQTLLEGTPTVLIKDGTPVTASLQQEGISHEELATAVREHGFADVSDVDLAMLEIDGSISAIKLEGDRAHRTRRRFRALKDRPL